jgi:all-trans-retinol 13,14-reductase
MAAAIFLTCLAVRADLAALGMGATNYWQFDGYDYEQPYAETLDGTPPRAHGVYITSATRKDPGTPGHAPPGVETIELMALAPADPAVWGLAPGQANTLGYRGEAIYKEHKARVEADLVARLERLFPGSTREVLHLESATPLTHGRFTGASGGTGYGLAATPGQFLANRPRADGPLPGLYFAGANLRSGHGVAGALASGAQAAKAITRGG